MGTTAETESERTPSGPLYGPTAVWQVERLPVRNRHSSEKYVFSACGANGRPGGITEQFKVDKQIEWVGHMNNIRQRTEEIINTKLIYS